MDTFQLYKQSGNPVNVWVCGKCGTVGWNKDAAERCCVPHTCKTCGKEEKMLECHECFTIYQAKLELARYIAAEKVTDWDGWVYADGPYPTRQYFAVRDVGWMDDRETDRRLVVVCAQCGAQGPAFGVMSFNDDVTAAQYWNTRAPDTEQLIALRAAADDAASWIEAQAWPCQHSDQPLRCTRCATRAVAAKKVIALRHALGKD